MVDGPDGRLADERRRLELLARDEWGGVRDMAQILAAYVSPNDAAVAALLKEASVLLERAGHDVSLEGYQSKNPQRAWLLAGAIWSAATGLGLSYAVPPASFARGRRFAARAEFVPRALQPASTARCSLPPPLRPRASTQLCSSRTAMLPMRSAGALKRRPRKMPGAPRS